MSVISRQAKPARPTPRQPLSSKGLRVVARFALLSSVGCVSVITTTPSEAGPRERDSATSVAAAYRKASQSGLFSPGNLFNAVESKDGLKSFNRWWCTKQATEAALNELRSLLSEHCAAREGHWRPHSDGMSAWCETPDEDGLLFFAKMGGNHWDKHALKSRIVPASAPRAFNCSEARAGLGRSAVHRDVDVYVVEAASGGPMDEAYVRRTGFVPRSDRSPEASDMSANVESTASATIATTQSSAPKSPRDTYDAAAPRQSVSATEVTSGPPVNPPMGGTSPENSSSPAELMRAIEANDDASVASIMNSLYEAKDPWILRELERNPKLAASFEASRRATEENAMMNSISRADRERQMTIAESGQRILNYCGASAHKQLDRMRSMAIGLYGQSEVAHRESNAMREGVDGGRPGDHVTAAALALLTASPPVRVSVSEDEARRFRLMVWTAMGFVPTHDCEGRRNR